MNELKIRATDEATRQWRAKFPMLFQASEEQDLLRRTLGESITGLIDLARCNLQGLRQDQQRAAESPEVRKEILGKLRQAAGFTVAILQEMLDRVRPIGNADITKAVEQAVDASRALILDAIVFREREVIIRRRLEGLLTWTGVSDETASLLVLEALEPERSV